MSQTEQIYSASVRYDLAALLAVYGASSASKSACTQVGSLSFFSAPLYEAFRKEIVQFLVVCLTRERQPPDRLVEIRKLEIKR